MNSIILIAACVVCLDQLLFRGRLASYVVDSLKGPEKSRAGHKAEPHTPKAVPAPRRSPEILISKSYRCGLERTSDPHRTGTRLYSHRQSARSRRCSPGAASSCSPRSARTANLRSPKLPPTPDLRFLLSPPEQNSAMRKFMRCSESWTSESALSWATPRPRSCRPSPTSTSGPLLKNERTTMKWNNEYG